MDEVDEEVFFSINPRELPVLSRLQAGSVSPSADGPLEEVCDLTRDINSQLVENNATLERRILELQSVCGLQRKYSELQKQVERLKREKEEEMVRHSPSHRSLFADQSIRGMPNRLEQNIQARLNSTIKEKEAILLQKSELESVVAGLREDKLSLEKEKQLLKSQLEELSTSNNELSVSLDTLTQKSIRESSNRIHELEAANEMLNAQLEECIAQRDEHMRSAKGYVDELSAVKEELASSQQDELLLSNKLRALQTELSTSQANEQDLQSRHEEEVEALRLEVAALQANENDLLERHQKELEAVLATSQASEQGLRERHKRELEALEASRQAEEQNLHRGYKAALDDTMKELEASMENLSQQKMATTTANREKEALVREAEGLKIELKAKDDQLTVASEEKRSLLRQLDANKMELEQKNIMLEREKYGLSARCAVLEGQISDLWKKAKYSQEQRLREENTELKRHITQLQMVTNETTEVEDMRRPDVGEQLPPPILPNGKHRTENFSSLGASTRPFDLRPQVDCCPICGRNNFASQADLELHSATCTNFN